MSSQRDCVQCCGGFVVCLDNDKNNECKARKFKVDSRGEIVSCGSFVWNPKVKVKVEIICSSRVKEILTSKLVTFCLLKVNNKVSDDGFKFYIACVDAPNESFRILRKLPDSTHFSEGTLVCLSDGPSVLMNSNGRLYFYRSEIDGTCSECSYKLAKGCRITKVFQIQLKSNENSYFVFCQRKQRSGDVDLCYFQIKDGSFKEINVNAFIPKEYVSCISALKLTKVSESGEDCVLQTSVIIGTEEGYIIYLVNGQLQRCVQLFQTPISYIEVSNELYVIGSDIVYTIVDQTFNTKVEALSAVHLVKGDFFQHGSDQFLLFKSYPEDGVKGLLFDASFNLMTPDNDTDNDGRDGHSNVQTAVRALNKRLQTEELIYQERVQECGRLEEFLSATLTRQLHLAEGGDAHISGTSYDLLPLITGETDIMISTRTKSPGFIFDVKSVWQRTYLHKWCVGVVISYKTERKVRAWLDLVPARGSGVTMTSSNARCVLIEPPDQSCGDGHSSSEPGALENDATGVDEVHASNSPSKPCEETLLSVTSVPRFDGEKVELTLILNWQVLTNELLVLDSLSSRREGNSRVFTRPCGQVTLAVAGVLKGNHALDVVKGTADTAESEMGDWDDVRYDRLAFMAIQTATDLEICASPGVLCRIETLLTDRCRLRYSHHLDCYMCDSPVLSGVQFRLGEQRPGAPARDAVFFAQGNDDVLLMVHYLYSKLPDEVIISTKEISRDSDSAKACREALKKEANFLSSGLKKLLGDRDSGHISDDENDQEDARKVGEKFKRQQKHYFEEKSNKIEVPSRVVQRLAQLQSQTDAAFIKYSVDLK